jgi:hypothetical protein
LFDGSHLKNLLDVLARVWLGSTNLLTLPIGVELVHVAAQVITLACDPRR